MSIAKLVQLVATLKSHGAFHKRRGTRVMDLPPEMISNGLLEEVVELQAEILNGDADGILDEAGDVLGVFLNLLNNLGLKLNDVAAQECKKLNENFTLDPNNIQTTTPGNTRRSRPSKG